MKKIYIFILATFFAVALPVFAHSEDKVKMGDEHRNVIVGVVQELREVADKDISIGEEVREIAKEQEQSGDDVADSIESIEKRGKFMTLLFGTDYKNLGVLRSELVKTTNHISRLIKVRDRSESNEVKIDIDTQISALESSNSKAEAFIQENESKFSFLGWFVKLFN